MPAGINCALLLAAGSGARMQGSVADKILTPIHGIPVFMYSLRAFVACESITHIGIVYRDAAQQAQLAALVDDDIATKLIWIEGGAERQDSVLNGLQSLPADASHTLIHDCARPLITIAHLERLIETTRKDSAACLAHPVTDTIKRIPAADALERTTLEDLQRNLLWAMETPQAFRHADILKAYLHVKAEGLHVTDDCAAAASIDIKATLIHNQSPNPKITTASDLDYVEWLIGKE
ncbi:2-C-methyl-D-erythritol 4-phosphate cytidylyltransferase [Coraliomargarita sinensis]|uniref:2-C-methyl-D-erythritol 4-phosphate cytidylyltransferase n=1 Tax=Coraliomargarita sinensis TaxID=2174842 RepID=A0A317ZCK8_9BACT|nr:IspD/TarI family cytidylyltransferase [Coraliomargarita sinensis]PXA02885.1 2-C-methyl-D-erythritol 4-phosphate cytidylyltransferase [Coraliomargarita sinensis]